jgi:hypothetical protein
MKISSDRAKKIDAYIETSASCATDEKAKVIFGGELHTLDVLRLPTNLLIFNIRNGRFRAELLEKEEELSRKLDPTDKKDSNIIKDLLLKQDDNETELLKADILKNGQIEPGIITFDGAVINANRRMAILILLFEDKREQKFSFIKVARLPQGVDEQDIWRIEAGLQFGKDFRLKYGGVNELLKLKEGKKQGLKEIDISNALMGRFSEKQVKEKLEILKLIESYLDFIGKPGEYHLIQDGGKLEHFISGHKAMEFLKKQGRHKELAEAITFAFLLISKTDTRHLDIRDIGRIIDNKDAHKELTKEFDINKPMKLSAEQLTENFATAREITKAHEERDKPERLLRRALSLVEGINTKNPKLKDRAIKELLKGLENRIKDLKQAANK